MVHSVYMTYTGERCDVAIDDSFTSGNVTGDVINKDDSFEENGTSLFSSFVSNCRMINYKIRIRQDNRDDNDVGAIVSTRKNCNFFWFFLEFQQKVATKFFC